MSDTISRCGIACNICPWSNSVQDSLSMDEYEELKVGCKELLGFAPTKSFQNCLGCMIPDEDIPEGSPIPLTSCKVRKCTMMNGIDNCAYCARFPCGRYIENRDIEWNRSRTEKKIKRKLSKKEYETLIKCWEGEDRLTAFRATLEENQIVEPQIMPPIRKRVKKFPNILISKPKITSLQKIHDLISDISTSTHGLLDTDIYIQQERLKSQIDEILRFLWIIGTYSSIDDKKRVLTIDAKSFLENRKGRSALGTWWYVEKKFRKFVEPFEINFEFIPLNVGKKGHKNWKMESGYLRKENWELNLTFTEKLGAFQTLKTFHDYCQKLQEKSKKMSYSYFKKADMSIYQ